MSDAVSSNVERVDSVTSVSVNSLTLRCELLPESVSRFSLSHVRMDCEELDDKRYI